MYWNLKDEMRRNHVTTAQLADLCGISESSMCKKLNGHSDFRLEEVKKIVSAFPNRTWNYLFDDASA